MKPVCSLELYKYSNFLVFVYQFRKQITIFVIKVLMYENQNL